MERFAQKAKLHLWIKCYSSSTLLIFLACTHSLQYCHRNDICMWARNLEKWEKDVLKGGTVMSKNENSHLKFHQMYLNI